MPNFTIDDSKLTPIKIANLDKAYIIKNASLEKILFNRNLVGIDFTRYCEKATEMFLRHFKPELLPHINNIAELMIMTKGMYYWIHNAFSRVFSENIEINFVETKRTKIEGNLTQIDIKSCNFDVPSENLIIGDTIASGNTICSVLSHYLTFHNLKRVFLFSIAGSITGVQKINQFCKSKNIDLTVAFGLAAFGLSKNGFDLSFLHPDTITESCYIKRAMDVYQGKPVSAVGWDFGSQSQAILKYKMLCWIESKVWELDDSDVFLLREMPTDLSLIEKEKGAFENFYLLNNK